MHLTTASFQFWDAVAPYVEPKHRLMTMDKYEGVELPYNKTEK